MANRRINVEHARDFTGGLNLQADPYNLDKNESFDLGNVDLDRRGGFAVRRGMRPYDNVSTNFNFSWVGGTNATATTMHTYVDPSGVRHLLAAAQGEVRRWNGAAWALVQAGASGQSDVSFAQQDGFLYFCSLSGAGSYRWNGAAVTSLPLPSYVDDLGAPVGGRMPQSAFLAFHKECMFSAWDQRVRWSHPGSAEDWRTNDWIDVGVGDGGSWVRAMVSFKNALVIFKKRGVYVLEGDPPSGFSLVKLTTELGVERPTAVCVTEDALYFWDARTGLWKYDGERLEYVFERIYPLIDDEKLDPSESQNAKIAYHRRRVYVAVVHQAEPWVDQAVTLVYAPDVGEQGAWTIHDTPARMLHVHDRGPGSEAQLLGATGGRAYEYDVEDVHEDEMTVGTTTAIPAWYTTRWFDARNPAMRKRWKRPIVVARSEQNTLIPVDVLTDYNPTTVSKTFLLETTLDVGDGVWDVGDWDDMEWAAEVGSRSGILRGANLGTGTAKALRFKNSTADEHKGQPWGIHGVSMKWIDKRMRA